MKTARKVLLLVMCAVLLICASVAGTVAYLTSQASVKNTFTVGDVKIILNEKDTDNDSDATDNVTIDGVARDAANVYHLLPGREYDKDPTIYVDAASEKCYVFVKVVNKIAAIESPANTIEAQMTAQGWKELAGAENVWYYDGTLATNSVVSAGAKLVVFETFTIDGAVSNATLATYATAFNADSYITVEAYAIQADGFTTAAAAWAAAPATWTP